MICLYNPVVCLEFKEGDNSRKKFLRGPIPAIVILSVTPSVRLSVTTRYRFKPRWDRDSRFSPYDSLEPLVSCEQISCRWVISDNFRLRSRISLELIKQSTSGKRRYQLRFFAHSTKTIWWTLVHWRKNDLDPCPMTLIFNDVRAVAKLHVLADYHQAECSGSWVIVLTVINK